MGKRYAPNNDLRPRQPIAGHKTKPRRSRGLVTLHWNVDIQRSLGREVMPSAETCYRPKMLAMNVVEYPGTFFQAD